MGDGTTLSEEESLKKRRWPRYGGALHSTLHAKHLVFQKALPLSILFSTLTSTCFKRLSDHCKTESLAAKGRKDMYKNQHVRAVDIPTCPNIVQVPPCKQDNTKMLSQDMRCQQSLHSWGFTQQSVISDTTQPLLLTYRISEAMYLKRNHNSLA